MTGFPSTQWSLIEAANQEAPSGSPEVIGRLLEQYWQPMYVHVRCKGLRTESAEDLIQDFMVELLNKELISVADPRRGKFRTLLLTALDRFMISRHRFETAAKRSPGQIAQLDSITVETAVAPDHSIDLAFDRAWAMNVLAEAFATMRRQCEAQDEGARWSIFESRLIAPILEDAQTPKYEDLAVRHGLGSEKAAMNLFLTAKRQFARTLRDTIRGYVTRGADEERWAEQVARRRIGDEPQSEDRDAILRTAKQQTEHAIQQAIDDELDQLQGILARSQGVADLVGRLGEVDPGRHDSDLRSHFFCRLTHLARTAEFDAKPKLDEVFEWGTETFPEVAESIAEKRFGRFVIQRHLGRGGMGEVVLAEDPDHARLVAIKTPLLGDDPLTVRRFLREGKAAIAIDHPHVCPTYEVGEMDGRYYIVMAFLDGCTLSKWVQRVPEVSLRTAVEITRKLTLGLQAIHDAGIIHRDLKPGNVIMTRDNEPHIMDFGMARQADGNESMLTLRGAVLGTPGYASPEQILGKYDALGPPSDVYSLGVILYELLTGWMPFSGDTLSVLTSVVSDSPPPPRTHNPNIPEELEEICLRALAKNPADRPSTARELGDALTAYLAGRTSAGETPATMELAPMAGLPGRLRAILSRFLGTSP